MTISFPNLGKFSTIIPSSIFSWSFFLSSSSGTPVSQMLGHLTLSWRALRLSSFLLICFSFFLSDSFISTFLSSTSLILSYASIILLFIPSRVFFLSHLLHYLLHIDSFLFFLGPCQTFFSVLVSRLFICDCIFISRFWIIFTVIIQNSLSGRFPISSSCLVLWAFILFLYLLGIPLSLHLV